MSYEINDVLKRYKIQLVAIESKISELSNDLISLKNDRDKLGILITVLEREV